MDFQAHVQGILVSNEGVVLLVTKDKVFRQWSTLGNPPATVSEQVLPSNHEVNESHALPQEEEMLQVANHMLGPVAKRGGGRKADSNSPFHRITKAILSLLQERGSMVRSEVMEACYATCPELKRTTVDVYAFKVAGVARNWGQWSLKSE